MLILNVTSSRPTLSVHRNNSLILAQVSVPHVYEEVAKPVLAITALTIKRYKICCWNILDQDRRAAFC